MPEPSDYLDEQGLFKAGNPGGPGRPPGPTQKWRQVDFWAQTVLDNIEGMKPYQRAVASLRMMELILSYKAIAPNNTTQIIAEMEKMFESRLQQTRKPKEELLGPQNGSNGNGNGSGHPI